jgi:hypothetical protein
MRILPAMQASNDKLSNLQNVWADFYSSTQDGEAL